MKLYAISNQEGKEKHLYFLPSQTLPRSKKLVDPTLRIQCSDRDYRDSFNQFTIFELENPETVELSLKKFYLASKCPIKAIAKIPTSLTSSELSIIPKDGDSSAYWSVDASTEYITITGCGGTKMKLSTSYSAGRPTSELLTVAPKFGHLKEELESVRKENILKNYTIPLVDSTSGSFFSSGLEVESTKGIV